MGYDRARGAAQRRLALWVTIAAIVLVPLAAPVANASPSSSTPAAVGVGPVSVENIDQPSEDDAFNTATLLGGVTAAVALIAALWWFLLIRRRD